MSPALPDPVTAPELFEGILWRRSVAYVIDLVLIGAMVLGLLLLGLIAGIVTLGLGWVALPLVVPLAILGYYAITLGSPRRATVGMAAMDIVLTPARGQPLDGWLILVHPILFWVTTWISWPLSLIFAFFTPRRQLVHDLLTGTLMLRRSPMEQHWRRMGMAGA
jgi:uncharacterized RDD family membrane protein YckC